MAKFSKKHYQAIAGELLASSLVPSYKATEQLEYAAERLATMFEQDNPRFNREHFMAVVRGERRVNSRPGRSK